MTALGGDVGKPLLSVLIPVYNWDLTLLLERLLREVAASAGEIEIVVADDCSPDRELARANAACVSRAGQPGLKYLPLEENLGRSGIRNFLVKQAAGDFLLFLDGDVVPDGDDFLLRYLHHAKCGSDDVVCGGISYKSRILLGEEYDYRVYFGNRKEVVPAERRNLAPGRCLLTANVMIRRSVFQQVPFDEAFVGYGYEDMDWGIRLARQWQVRHIENTVSHLGLDDRQACYEKLMNSVPNYLRIRAKYPAEFSGSMVGRLAEAMQYSPRPVLRVLESVGSRFATSKFVNKILAFAVMQMCFAVSLALGMKSGRQGNGGR